ncbi:hemE [Symbiodinium pilosum]|uniref:Uroporphyrinogen decarboxylase n=1 Tax=Symbiodinium pilosum TaxID=2952 RepID=A0A812VLN1_SYMPI|nr:hemE [Symbiodinium pilosum]
MADTSLGFVAASPSLPAAIKAPRPRQSAKPECHRCSSSSIVLGAAASLCVATGRRQDRRRACTVPRLAELGSRDTPSPHDLLLRVARGETGDHTPVWLMRQAGRYMKAFRNYSERYPFRQRSETPDMAIELSLQCWRQYGMDGVIVFSDILTPLPAMGINFDVVRGRGPIVLGDLARTLEDRLQDGPSQIREVTGHEGFKESHGFLRETLQALRSETEEKCSLLGFVGAPWTLAAYAVEAGSTKEAAVFKKWMFSKPEVVDEFLRRMTVTISNYAIYQVKSGAQCIQIFESWAHCLTPELWRRFAAPCVQQVVATLRKECPGVPIIYFANGGSSYLRDQVEALQGQIDVLGVDGHMRLDEAAKIVDGTGLVLQGNVDPYVLRYGSESEVRQAVRDSIDAVGGPGRHILNLGHGVLQGTPEENVLFFVEEAQRYQGTSEEYTSEKELLAA